METHTITGALSGVNTILGGLSGDNTITGSLSVGHVEGEYFTGDYEYTPSEDTQTIAIADKVASQDIVINPIPSNYGRIARVGAVIRVY